MALPTLFVRWKALDPAVNTVAVVIDSEGGKLSFKIELIPKQHLVEQILPNRSDDALDLDDDAPGLPAWGLPAEVGFL